MGAITIDTGTALVLVYVLGSVTVVVAFLWAVFVIGPFLSRPRERRSGQRGEE